MKITSDWHIHSERSCDSACMPVGNITLLAKKNGILDFGLTDHLHTPFNLPDIANSRKDFLVSRPPAHFHFGIEVSCISQWELGEISTGKHQSPVYGIRNGGPPGCPLAIGITDEEIKKYGIEYVVGGAHWPIYVPMEPEVIVRDYHRQNMFLATHKLVDIVAHPWWWAGDWHDSDGIYRTEPWFDDFCKILSSMHDEFARACVENRKVVEINIEAMLLNHSYTDEFKQKYLEYLAGLKGRNVKLCIGSDCHLQTYEINFEKAAKMLDSIGIKSEELWTLPPRNN